MLHRGAGLRGTSQPVLAAPSRAQVCRRPLVVAGASFQGTVRPYTLRKGDTLESIARKRDITVDQLINMNPDLNVSELSEGQTMLLPAGKLSLRDKEILDGIGVAYRLYPVRAGESLEDIILKRKISVEEVQSLNPNTNLQKLPSSPSLPGPAPTAANTLLKLPANKFTVREREMLIGSGIVPPEFFAAAKNPFVIGVGALLGVCGFVLAWMKFHRDEDFDEPLPGAKQRV
ncbi:hypothetical protein QJQ45_009080 [Haematococcus lacustris]|nr:hypothetical protein QJQ45_009080 [Haematococcus lacustris]